MRITKENEDLIYLLLHTSDFRQLKAGLQYLCEILESRTILREKAKISDVLISLLWKTDIEVRRWTYKAIALIVDPARHVDPLIARIRSGDNDQENMTWAIAALFSIASQGKLEELIEEKVLPLDGISLLAASLYGSDKFAKISTKKLSINIERADPLTLKWASLLIGYDKAPQNLFDPRHDNKVLLGELNLHDDPHVSEYSIWSLFRNDRFSLEDLGFSLDISANLTENVRRWVYRLVTKNKVSLCDHLDHFEDFAKDPSPKAREGLAKGIKTIWLPSLTPKILSWYSGEDEPMVKDALIEHMARYNQEAEDYYEISFEEFKSSNPGDTRRARIEAASVQTALYTAVKREKILEEAKNELPEKDLFVNNTNILNVNNMEMHMNNNNQTINTKNNNIGQNVIGGSARAETGASVSGVSNLNSGQSEAIEGLREFLSKDLLNSEDTHLIENAVSEINDQPINDKVQKLKLIIEKIIESAKYGTGIINELKGIWEKIAGLF